MRKTICAVVAAIGLAGCAAHFLSTEEMDRITSQDYKGPVVTLSGQKKNIRYEWDSDSGEGKICERKVPYETEDGARGTYPETCFRVKPDYKAGRLRVKSICVLDGKTISCYYSEKGLVDGAFQQAQDKVDAYTKGILEVWKAEEAKSNLQK